MCQIAGTPAPTLEKEFSGFELMGEGADTKYEGGAGMEVEGGDEDGDKYEGGLFIITQSLVQLCALI